MSSAATVLTLLRALDGLYEDVVMQPGDWSDSTLAEWAGETLADTSELPAEASRIIRRAVRRAARLQRYWSTRPASPNPPDDWRMRVDEAVGSRGWVPGLELARWGLSAYPDPGLFEEVRRRFRWAHFQEWMEGIDFEEWMDGD